MATTSDKNMVNNGYIRFPPLPWVVAIIGGLSFFYVCIKFQIAFGTHQERISLTNIVYVKFAILYTLYVQYTKMETYRPDLIPYKSLGSLGDSLLELRENYLTQLEIG